MSIPPRWIENSATCPASDEDPFEKENITTLMITHNMEQALELGRRLIMLHEGSLILDVNDGERDGLTVPKLVELFHAASGEQLHNDRLLLH